jgi:molybdenum cofactor guanylyltransferase
MQTKRPDGSRPEQRTAVILAGGASRRFGRNKAFAVLDGKPLIEHVIANLNSNHDEVIIAGPRAPYAHYGLRIIEDRVPLAGPLVTLAHLWDHLDGDRILLIPCDMPRCDETLLNLLWQAHIERDMVVPTRRGIASPLPGVYGRRCHEKALACIAAGRHDLRALFESTLTRYLLDARAMGRADPRGRRLWNVNTQADLLEC